MVFLYLTIKVGNRFIFFWNILIFQSVSHKTTFKMENKKAFFLDTKLSSLYTKYPTSCYILFQDTNFRWKHSNKKGPVKLQFYGTFFINSGETGFWTCQPILSVYQRYNIKVKNKCSKIVAHFWRLFETLLNAYAIILSRFKDTKKRTHCQMLYNKYFQPLHCYTF